MDGLSNYKNRVKELETENLLLRNKLEFHELFNEFSINCEVFRDISGTPIYISPTFDKITSYSHTEFLNKKEGFNKLVYPDDLELVKENMQKQSNQQAINDFVFRIYDKDGDIKYLSVCSQPVYNHAKEFIGTRTTYVDVTKLQQTENALKESQLKLKTIFDYCSEGIILVNEDGQIVDWNNYIEKTTGIKQKSVLGEFVWDIQYKLAAPEIKKNASAEDLKKYWQRRIFSLVANQLASGIGKIINSSGEHKSVEDLVSPIFIDNKKFYLVFQRDVTESENAKLALRESEEHLRLIADNLPVLISHINIDFEYLFVNSTYKKIFGKEKEEIIGKKVVDIIGEEAFSRCQPYYDKLFSGETVQIENKIIDTNKKERIMQAVFVPEIQNNKVIGYFTLTIDVTDQKNSDLIIKKQNEELTKLNADKDHFMSILAHDLKNPFNSILGFLELLSLNVRLYDIDKTERIIKNVTDSAIRTYNLLEDLLQWKNAQAGNLNFSPEKLNFKEVCNKIIAQLNYPAANKNIKINLTAGKNGCLLADKNMVSSILRNLIFNAVKFTKNNGEIKISLKGNSNVATIIISDNGIGIEPHKLKKIFDGSFNETTAGTNNEKGTGFGLLLCKEFVKIHGGKIWAESKIGEGSDFMFTIPLYRD